MRPHHRDANYAFSYGEIYGELVPQLALIPLLVVLAALVVELAVPVGFSMPRVAPSSKPAVTLLLREAASSIHLFACQAELCSLELGCSACSGLLVLEQAKELEPQYYGD